MAYTELLDGMSPQKLGKLTRVQVICVVGDARVLWRCNHLRREALLAYGLLKADRRRERSSSRLLVPVRSQIDLRERLRQHQRVIVEITRVAVHPACELRTLFECSFALADELRFADADLAQRVAHGRPGAFADADRRDRRRFDECDAHAAGTCVVPGGDARRGDPACCATTDNDNLLDWCGHYQNVARMPSAKRRPLSSANRKWLRKRPCLVTISLVRFKPSKNTARLSLMS